MSKVKFGDIVNDVKEKVDRDNNPYEYYVAGDHMDSDDLTIRRKGRFATDDVGPAFIMLFKKGQVLYGSRRTYLRKIAVADFDGVTANTTFVLETKDESVLRQRLLPFIMYTDKFTEWSIKKSKGSTNPYVLFKDLADFEFELPDIHKQDELADILWSIVEAKDACNTLLSNTDSVLQSRFISMFGDPDDNPFGWKKCSISEVMRGKVSNGFFTKPKDYCDDGNTGVICVGDVVNRKYSNVDHLRRANASDKDFDKYRVYYGDMLFCRSSLVKEGIGKASIVPQGVTEDTIFECHVIRVPLNTEVVLPEFMQELSVSDYFRTEMMNKSKTATMTTIGQKDIIETEIYVPPMELQEQFLVLSEQADRSKKAIEESKLELNAIYKKMLEETIN